MKNWIDGGFGIGWYSAYNERSNDDVDPLERRHMRKTLTTIRCVPRYGYDHTEVRTVDLDLFDEADERELLAVLRAWFALRGIQDAVYDLDVDDNGFFAIINDEAYRQDWGEPLL